jgi:hypothetical protein
MHGKAARMRHLGEPAHLVHPVDGAGFARLRERKHRRSDMMRPAPLAVERARQGLRRNLAARPRKADELDATTEEFRRAAFIGGDMRLVVAEHRAPWRCEMRERQRIGGGAGRHEKNGDVALEHVSEPPLEAGRPVVVAIGERRPLIRARDGRQNLRRDPCGVVAGEIHGKVTLHFDCHRPLKRTMQ